MLYIQTLRKFNYDEDFVVSEIIEYNEATEKHGFCDNYIILENGTLTNQGANNYIMNAGPWICILDHNDLSIKDLL